MDLGQDGRVKTIIIVSSKERQCLGGTETQGSSLEKTIAEQAANIAWNRFAMMRFAQLGKNVPAKQGLKEWSPGLGESPLSLTPNTSHTLTSRRSLPTSISCQFKGGKPGSAVLHIFSKDLDICQVCCPAKDTDLGVSTCYVPYISTTSSPKLTAMENCPGTMAYPTTGYPASQKRNLTVFI